jgi:chromosome segregation ATPase
MKHTIKRLLAAIGLVPIGQVHVAAAELKRAANRTAKLQERVAHSRDDAESWKHRHEESSAALAAARRAASASDAEAARFKADAVRATTRAAALTEQVQDMRRRLDEARRLAATANEHLMATEVKLDLIEAAIQVLDARTREAAVPAAADRA